MTSRESVEKSAFYGVILFGIVSLLGDIVYEGARSAIPEYLKLLGASAALVGLVSGIGELIAYIVRLPAGFWVDISGMYWVTTFLGYGLLFSIPILSIVSSVFLAVTLVALERFGKGIRAPSRDALLSVVSKGVGSGKAFGIHEFLDQVGAILGPILVASVLYYTASFKLAFSLLFIPVILCLLALFIAYSITKPKTAVIEKKTKKMNFKEEMRNIPKEFWLYSVAVFLSTAGFVHYALLSYRLQGLVPDWVVALSYSLAMAIDAIFALMLGFLYDKYKFKVFYFVLLVNSLPAILAIFPNPLLLVLSIAAFGIGMGAQESIYRSAVADLIPIRVRGTAYGIFNTLYGLSWTVGGLVAGFLYDLNQPTIVAIFSILMELTAACFTMRIRKIQ